MKNIIFMRIFMRMAGVTWGIPLHLLISSRPEGNTEPIATDDDDDDDNDPNHLNDHSDDDDDDNENHDQKMRQ